MRTSREWAFRTSLLRKPPRLAMVNRSADPSLANGSTEIRRGFCGCERREYSSAADREMRIGRDLDGAARPARAVENRGTVAVDVRVVKIGRARGPNLEAAGEGDLRTVVIGARPCGGGRDVARYDANRSRMASGKARLRGESRIR